MGGERVERVSDAIKRQVAGSGAGSVLDQRSLIPGRLGTRAFAHLCYRREDASGSSQRAIQQDVLPQNRSNPDKPNKLVVCVQPNDATGQSSRLF